MSSRLRWSSVTVVGSPKVAANKGFQCGSCQVASYADVVAKAIRARKPRTRYTVGRDAAVMTRLTHLVSDRLLDRMVRHTMGL
jgi:hypothetical protein